MRLVVVHSADAGSQAWPEDAVEARLEAAGRRFARLTTRVVVARPALWRLFRGPTRRQFGSLAASWEGRIGPEGLVPLGAALDRCRQQGVDAVILWPTPESRSLYERHGFKSETGLLELRPSGA